MVVPSNGLWDAALLKFGSDGTFQWARSWGGTASDVAISVAVDGVNNVYSAGWFANTVDFGARNASDVHVSAGPESAFVSVFQGQTSVSPGAGGVVTVTTGVTDTLVFPPGETALTVTVSLTSTRPVSAGVTAVGQAHVVSAVDNSGTPVTGTLAQPFTLTVNYTGSGAMALNPATLQVCYWDTQAQAWHPVTSTVDTVNHTVAASVNRTAMFALFGVPYPWRVHLPLMSRWPATRSRDSTRAGV